MTHDLTRHSALLRCPTGEVQVSIGQTFVSGDVEWVITAFKALPVSLNVVAKPTCGEVPSIFKRFRNEDGSIDFCADSVAAAFLERQDGLPRDTRGNFLKRA